MKKTYDVTIRAEDVLLSEQEIEDFFAEIVRKLNIGAPFRFSLAWVRELEK
jgi:hypothetical protein